jgi:hypothetical protein
MNHCGHSFSSLLTIGLVFVHISTELTFLIGTINPRFRITAYLFLKVYCQTQAVYILHNLTSSVVVMGGFHGVSFPV